MSTFFIWEILVFQILQKARWNYDEISEIITPDVSKAISLCDNAGSKSTKKEKQLMEIALI